MTQNKYENEYSRRLDDMTIFTLWQFDQSKSSIWISSRTFTPLNWANCNKFPGSKNSSDIFSRGKQSLFFNSSSYLMFVAIRCITVITLKFPVTANMLLCPPLPTHVRKLYPWCPGNILLLLKSQYNCHMSQVYTYQEVWGNLPIISNFFYCCLLL